MQVRAATQAIGVAIVVILNNYLFLLERGNAIAIVIAFLLTTEKSIKL
jgi:hypothetical protein